MNDIRNWVIALMAVAGIAAGGGYYLGQTHESTPSPTQLRSAPAMSAATPETKTPIYYQDPDGKPDYSPTPKKTGDGRDFKPVYDEAAGATSAQGSTSAAQGKGKILYYRNPMGLPDTSPVPKKDSMGMAYIPVYENETGADAGIVTVSPARVQMLGVRTATVRTQAALTHTIRTTGSVQFDERRLAAVTAKVGGWVEKLDVAATGETVRAGQPLLEIYSPDLVAAEQEYLVAASMGDAAAHGDMVHGDTTLIADAATQRLRALDVSVGEIQRLRRTGTVARRIPVLAPANGIVTEKDAVLGMHLDPGTTLYKTADLSTVWLIAQVQEQDLGQIRPGQAAHATLVAFPGRVFNGIVDFVYPTLSTEMRTAKVRIVIPNTDYLLRADMYATVEIQAAPNSASTSMLVIPSSAIIDSGNRQAVLVVKGKGRFEPRAVRLGARGDGSTQVLSGLREGEQIVTSANFLIDAESNLRAALQSFTAPPANASTAQSQGAAQ
jgi:Cu(I)/Ag(I) efflux system membrane fusion protein